ncbi:hypothetical protein ACHAXM_005801 [Skeletonema potamos]
MHPRRTHPASSYGESRVPVMRMLSRQIVVLC